MFCIVCLSTNKNELLFSCFSPGISVFNFFETISCINHVFCQVFGEGYFSILKQILRLEMLFTSYHVALTDGQWLQAASIS